MVDDSSPSGPQHPSRKARWSCFGLGAFLHGLGLVALIYVGGLLFLVGDPRQELYILPGIILGAALWGLVGGGLVRYLRSPLLPSILISAFEVLALVLADLYFPVVTDLDLFLRSILCTALGIPIAVATLPRFMLRRDSGKTLLWGAALVVGPTVMGIIYSLIYAELNFSDFAFLVLYTEAAAAILLAVYVGLAFRGAPRTGRAGSGPGPSKAGVLSPTPASGTVPPTDGSEMPDSISHVRGAGAPRGRRARVLAPMLAIGFALLLIFPPSTTATTAGGSGPEGLSPVTKIQHVVMIMMENHAFDNLFGTYPQLAGSGRLAAGVTVPTNFLSTTPPWPSSQISNGTWNTVDPIEGYAPYHLDWDGGRMDGFAAGSGPQSLTYFNANQTAAEWDWAEEYTLGDNYFASDLTETTPNRLYTLAGYSPVINDYGPPPYVPLDQTIFGELDSYGVPWGYYLNDPSLGLGTLNFIQGLSASTPNIGSWEDFTDQLTAGTLPAVSWLQPVDGGLGDQFSQGPPGNVLQGEMWLLYFIDAIMESPEWSSTAIFLTYDEGGGYYDGVDPPILDGEQLGQRVPFLVISPYARENYVSNTLMNHDSQIAFVEYNWGLPALNSFVSQSDLPLDMFDFSQAPRAPLPFTAAEGFPTPSGLPQLPSIPVPSDLDLGPLFPQPFQEESTGVGGEGASDTDLAGLGAGIFVTSDVPYTPAELSLPFLAAVLVLEVGVWVLLPLPPAWRGRWGRLRAGARPKAP